MVERKLDVIAVYASQAELSESRRVEARLPWKQFVASALVAAVVAARYLWFA